MLIGVRAKGLGKAFLKQINRKKNTIKKALQLYNNQWGKKEECAKQMVL